MVTITDNDLSQFVEQWRSVAPRLRAHIARLGFKREEIEDILQDVALKLLRTGTQNVDGEHFTALAMTAARWASIDRWRSLSFREEPTDPEVISQHLSSHSHDETAEKSFAMKQALESLSPREQDVLRMIAAGKTYDETAEALQIAPATVRSLVRHARLRIVESLI